VQNILYSRIGIDELETLFERQMLLFKEYLNYSADSASNKKQDVKKLIHISLIQIFIAHATITDASQHLSSKPFFKDLSRDERMTRVFS